MRISEKKSEGGQSLVEFAVALVILLYLVVVIADGARALFTYLSMRDAAQEAAAYASYQPADTAGIIRRACEASNMMDGLCGDTSTCTGSDPANCGSLSIPYPTLTGTGACMETAETGAANGITVAIDYPQFPLAMPFVATFIGRQWVPIHTEVTDTILSPKCP